jgi:2-dehydropantoate 2-reductase
VEVVDDIRSAKWMKLVVNAAELTPSAIVDLPLLEAAVIADRIHVWSRWD